MQMNIIALSNSPNFGRKKTVENKKSGSQNDENSLTYSSRYLCGGNLKDVDKFMLIKKVVR